MSSDPDHRSSTTLGQATLSAGLQGSGPGRDKQHHFHPGENWNCEATSLVTPDTGVTAAWPT